MLDHQDDPGPQSTEDRGIYFAFLLLILGLFAASVFHDYSPVKLSALLIVLFWVPLLVLHEGSHAVVAALLGWHVSRVVIGVGKPIWQFHRGKTVVDLRIIPVAGFVEPRPNNLYLPQLKHMLIYLAGPGSELTLAGLILWVAGPDRLLVHSNDYGTIIWQSLAVAAAAQGIINLIPFGVFQGDQMLASDGLGILYCFARPTSDYAAMIDENPNGNRIG